MSAIQKLVAKALDGILRVLVIGRVWKVDHQPQNIEGHVRRCLAERCQYDGPVHVKHLGERGSGMRTDRETILEANKDLESGLYDLVLMEDLSKAYRRWIYAFVQDAVDRGVRVIAPGDSLDTANENWEVMLGALALRHCLPETRRRVRLTKWTPTIRAIMDRVRRGDSYEAIASWLNDKGISPGSAVKGGNGPAG